MNKTMFTMQGNICGERIRLGRALQKRSMSQEGLAIKLRAQGLTSMTKLVISRIENNQRHVCDAELRAISKALGVSMDWLVGSAALEEIFRTDSR